MKSYFFTTLKSANPGHSHYLLESHRSIVTLLATVVISGILVSFAFFYIARNQHQRNLTIEFERTVDTVVASLKREIAINIEVLRGMRSLFLTKVEVSPTQFTMYAKPAVKRYPSIQALEWIPHITRAERAQFEQAVRIGIFPKFEITERHSQGNMVKAGRRAEYFPVYYLEPLHGNELAVGFDLGSSNSRLATLIRSRDTGKMLATAPIMLVQETAQQRGFLVFVPIYSRDSQTVDERHRHLRGFVLGVYRVGDLFAQAFGESSNVSATLSINLFDVTDSREEILLHQHLSEHADSTNRQRAYDTTFTIAGRTWRFVARPTAEFLAMRKTWQAPAILLSSFGLTLLLTAYLATLMTRQIEVKRLVALRTGELEASERRTRTILDTAVDSIITADKNGIVQLFNPAAERMFGYRADEIIGENLNRLMPEPYHSEHDRYLARYQQTGEAHIIGIGREVIAQRKNGSSFPIKLSVGEANIGDESLYVGIVTDITLHKQAENALRAAKEQAEENNRLKSEFVNMMSHELRTPLTVILGYLPLLKNKRKLPAPEIITTMARDIEYSGNHLLELINDLLDLSKIEAGKMILNCEPILAHEVIATVVDTLRSQAGEKKLEFQYNVDDIVVNADPIRLRQILINLIGNAIKFTDHGGITVTGRQLKQSVEFAVHDTGCGISPQGLPSIFEKFRQVDGSSTRIAGGSGLGLAITRRLVELHGGQISVESTLGKGSVFTFSIANKEGHH